MKLKKAGALGLSCVIALGSMAGCGSSKEKEKTDGKEEISGEIRYAFWDTAQQPYFEKCIEKFNEQYPDVKVTLEPSSWDEYWTKLEAGATGGSIADVFWMNGPNIMKYADGDVLMDIVTVLKKIMLIQESIRRHWLNFIMLMENSMQFRKILTQSVYGTIRRFLMKQEFHIQQMTGHGMIWQTLQNS